MEGPRKEKMKRYYDNSDKDWKLIEQKRSGGEEVCKRVCVVCVPVRGCVREHL